MQACPANYMKMQCVSLCTELHILTVFLNSMSRIMVYWGTEVYQKAAKCIRVYTQLPLFHNIDAGFQSAKETFQLLGKS